MKAVPIFSLLVLYLLQLNCLSKFRKTCTVFKSKYQCELKIKNGTCVLCGQPKLAKVAENWLHCQLLTE